MNSTTAVVFVMEKNNSGDIFFSLQCIAKLLFTLKLLLLNQPELRLSVADQVELVCTFQTKYNSSN